MQIWWLQFVPPQIVLLKTRLPISPGFQHSIYPAIDSQCKRANLTPAPNPPQQRRFIALLCRNVPDLLGCARLEQPQGHFALGLGTDLLRGPEDTGKQQLFSSVSPGSPPKPEQLNQRIIAPLWELFLQRALCLSMRILLQDPAASPPSSCFGDQNKTMERGMYKATGTHFHSGNCY